MNETTIMLPSVGNHPDWQFMSDYIQSIEREYSTNNTELPEITTESWEEFELCDLFSDVYRSKSNIKSELVTSDICYDGFLPFVSRTEKNNGCDCYVQYDDGMVKECGNAISIGDTTSTIFYQPVDFVTGDHMVICRSEWMNPQRALFVISLIDRERYRYSYGRAFKMDLIKSTKISLPSKHGSPDWKSMDAFISKLPYGDFIRNIDVRAEWKHNTRCDLG